MQIKEIIKAKIMIYTKLEVTNKVAMQTICIPNKRKVRFLKKL
jgi:hypothetical protein